MTISSLFCSRTFKSSHKSWWRGAPVTPTDASSILSSWLGENPNDAGNLVQFALHGRDQFFFIFVEDMAATAPSAQVHKYSGVKEAGVIRPVVWPPHLTCAFAEPRGRETKYDSRLIARGCPHLGQCWAQVCANPSAPSSRWGRNSEPMTPLKAR